MNILNKLNNLSSSPAVQQDSSLAALVRLSLLCLFITVICFAYINPAYAIVYGREDCTDNVNNEGCEYPNVGRIVGFDADGRAVGLCSMSFIGRDQHKAVMLTAGHCLTFPRSRGGEVDHWGITFDATSNPFNDSEFYTGTIYFTTHPLHVDNGGPDYVSKKHIDLHDVALLILPRTDDLDSMLNNIDPLPIADSVNYVETQGYLNASVSSSSGGFTTVGYGLSEPKVVKAGDGGSSTQPNPRDGLLTRSIAEGVHILGDGEQPARSRIGGEQIAEPGDRLVNMLFGQASPSGNHPGAAPGDSGGPTIDPLGKIIGVHAFDGEAADHILVGKSFYISRVDSEDAWNMIMTCALSGSDKDADAAVACVENLEWRN